MRPSYYNVKGRVVGNLTLVRLKTVENQMFQVHQTQTTPLFFFGIRQLFQHKNEESKVKTRERTRLICHHRGNVGVLNLVNSFIAHVWPQE